MFDVVLGGSLANGSTTLGVEGGVVIQQSHSHVRVVIIAIERSVDGLA